MLRTIIIITIAVLSGLFLWIAISDHLEDDWIAKMVVKDTKIDELFAENERLKGCILRWSREKDYWKKESEIRMEKYNEWLSEIRKSGRISVDFVNWNATTSHYKYEIIDLYKRGMSAGEIGVKLGFSKDAVRKALVKWGVWKYVRSV